MRSNPNTIAEIPVFEKQMIRMIAACTRPARPAGAVPRPSPRAPSLDPPAAITTLVQPVAALRLKTPSLYGVDRFGRKRTRPKDAPNVWYRRQAVIPNVATGRNADPLGSRREQRKLAGDRAFLRYGGIASPPPEAAPTIVAGCAQIRDLSPV